MESNTGKLQDHDPSISISYMDFEPYCAWHREEGQDTLAIHIHGFKKEQMRVQVNSQRMLTIHGQRPLDETKWSRFTKQIKLPEGCSEEGIRAKFAAGILTITMPKRRSSSTAHETERSSTRNDDSVIKKQQAVTDEDNKKKSVSEMLKIAGKVAAVVLVLAVSGAYVNCICKHPSSGPIADYS